MPGSIFILCPQDAIGACAEKSAVGASLQRVEHRCSVDWSECVTAVAAEKNAFFGCSVQTGFGDREISGAEGRTLRPVVSLVCAGEQVHLARGDAVEGAVRGCGEDVEVGGSVESNRRPSVPVVVAA